MSPPLPVLPQALISLGEALLIGLLVGFQREAALDERQAGFRDFVLIALTGGICGLLGNAWLTVATLLAIAALLAVFHVQARERTGITTEMAAVATFCLGFLTATPNYPSGSTLAIGTTIVLVAFLEAKRTFQKLIRETITEAEFNDTLRFLAIIFIIYPLLPEGEFGPYGFLAPRKIWLFVILVSSISYLGYFLGKFLGARKGLQLAGLFGALASTTAATLAFAQSCRANPQDRRAYWQAGVTANAIQFPRILAILWIVNPDFARASLLFLLAMCLAGLLLAFGLSRFRSREAEQQKLPVGNPFRLKPALRFGAVFALVLLITKVAGAEFGSRGVMWASALAGSVDVDAVVVSLSQLVGPGELSLDAARIAVFLAVAGNAVLKTALAAYAGTLAFALRMGLGFLVMLVPGALLLFVRGA